MQREKDKEKNPLPSAAVNKDINRLKGAWTHLLKMQSNRGRGRRSKSVGQIASIELVTDTDGRQKVQINLVGGGKVLDAGDKRAVFQEMLPQKNINLGRIASLLDAVREFGFDAVAAGLSPSMKALLMKACRHCGINLKKREKIKTAPVQSKPRFKWLFNLRNEQNKALSLLTPPAPPPSVEINSPRQLQNAVNRQIAMNKEYLDYVLKRTEERARDRFFDHLRGHLAEIKQKDGSFLTDEEKNILKLAKRYGLEANRNEETPSKHQMRARQELDTTTLPHDIQCEMHAAKKRYRAICDAKNKAVKLAEAEQVCHRIGKDGQPLTSDALAREAAAKLPADRSIENLQSFLKEIGERLDERRAEIKTARQERRDRVCNILRQVCATTDRRCEKKPTRSANAHRKNFKDALSPTLLREIAGERLATR